MPDTHTQSEDHAWTIDVSDHPARADSPIYVQSRALMVEICKVVGVPFYGPDPWQDHHSGVLWVFNGVWRMFANLAGIEWSAQFSADPAKVELLRQNAAALFAAFPQTLGEFDKLGHPEQRAILAKAIETADDVATWTDSIFNASMPLPQPVHTGSIKPGADGSKPIAGIHFYPKPIWDQMFFKHDDFTLWVTDSEGNPAAVNPMAAKGSGDSRVQVVYAHPGSQLHTAVTRSASNNEAHVLPASHDLAQQAFANQTAPDSTS